MHFSTNFWRKSCSNRDSATRSRPGRRRAATSRTPRPRAGRLDVRTLVPPEATCRLRRAFPMRAPRGSSESSRGHARRAVPAQSTPRSLYYGGISTVNATSPVRFSPIKVAHFAPPRAQHRRSHRSTAPAMAGRR
jgi:hypothetical protein